MLMIIPTVAKTVTWRYQETVKWLTWPTQTVRARSSGRGITLDRRVSHTVTSRKASPMTTVNLATDIHVLLDKNATVAEVALSDIFGITPMATATGSAKRDKGDVFNQEIAVNLAVGRALENLGRQLRRKGEAQVAEAQREAETEDEEAYVLPDLADMIRDIRSTRDVVKPYHYNYGNPLIRTRYR